MSTTTTSASSAAVVKILDLEAARAVLAKVNQEHLLKYASELTPTQRAELLSQIASIDWATIPALVQQYVLSKEAGAAGGSIEPVKHYPADATSSAGRGPWDRTFYKQKGIELIRAGKVAAFTVAGGQGSRLGFEGPKGCYPAGSVTRKPLFACLAEWIIAAQRAWCAPGKTIPWYIMTSPLNHEATVSFFKKHGYFGLNERDVMFFRQGVMPSFDMATGKVLLNQKHEIAVNPDGHGGSIKALAVSGALADMKRRGIEQLSYTQIDNPLVKVIDPVFVGLHAFAPDSSGQMSSKMVAKASAGEKVGVLCVVNGKTGVVEYSDMPKALTEATNADGSLKFNAGSIAVHVISVKFLEQLTGGGGFSMPFHRAEKKVAYVDESTGQRVEPVKNNAVKLEAFVFDALAMCEKSIVLETIRRDEFAPIKNASAPGASDTPETCSQIQTERALAWLAQAWGVGGSGGYAGAGQDCVLELPPTSAMEPEDLRIKNIRPVIARGAKLVL
ncbi:MAG: UDPGP type 1 family protein [Phycisphaerales bacterium]|nr:UDPGP type 1 family protein [Phycisphaerales bacterium]